MDQRTVAIVGGGVAGLTAAVQLADRGHTVALYEAEESVGGQVRSEHREGFTLDRGFQVLFTSYPTVSQVLDFSELRLRRFRPGAVLARRGMRTVLADPLRDPRAILATLSCPEVTTADKLRTLLLRWQLRRMPFDEIFEGPDRSIAAELRRRGFSDAYIGHFARPFFGAITQDPHLDSSKQLFEYIFKALTMGAIGVPSAGMGAISAQLATRAQAAGVAIRCGHAVDELTVDAEGVVVHSSAGRDRVDATVVATDPQTAAALVPSAQVPTETRSTITQHYALPAEGLPETGRRIILDVTGADPAVVVPMSEVAPSYAPADAELLVASFIDTPLDCPSETLAAATADSLAAWYPERSFDDMRVLATDRIADAQPVQPPGFAAERPAVTAPPHPVVLAGAVTRWASIEGAIASGMQAAAVVHASQR